MYRSSLTITSRCLRASRRWLVIGLLLGPHLELSAALADPPVTPAASREAQSLLAYFRDHYGRQILSGQQDGWQMTNGLSRELNYLTNVTGKLPALLALDVAGVLEPAARRAPSHRLMTHAAEWFNERNGIVSFCWHWRAPMNEPAFYTKETSFDITRAVTEGTPEQAAVLRDLDLVATELEQLRDAHVPVLWRPLHEANGRWFWWGGGGPEPMKKLWRMMFENFTVKHRLNNLIWVFSPGAATELAAWYPGDAYVDIIGVDHYPLDDNHDSAKDIFDELNQLTHGSKLLALGENGPVPDPQQLVKDQAGWLFFTTWNGDILFNKTSPEQLRAYYQHPYMRTLGDLPDLKTYPFPASGRAVQLGFGSAPGDVAVGGTRRTPVTVTVQDRKGRTVREGTYAVTLALRHPQAAHLHGQTTVNTINGVATFPDASITGTVADYRFIASTKGLRSATSPAFHLGPGQGLWRESWFGEKDPATPPTHREFLGTALETPVAWATNFTARIRGQLIPPQSGRYRFWLAASGAAEFWLGTNTATTNLSRLAAITAETPYRKWPHINEAETGCVTLQAGQPYSLELRQHQPLGSTQLHVRWQLPDGREERPIPAFRLANP